MYCEYAITKRSDIYTKTASCEKRVQLQNAREKKDVKIEGGSQEMAVEWQKF